MALLRGGRTLLAAESERNLPPTAVEQQLNLMLALPTFQAALASVAKERAEAQRTTHERVRAASRERAARGASRSRSRIAVEPVLPVEVLGACVLLPALPSAAGAAPDRVEPNRTRVAHRRSGQEFRTIRERGISRTTIRISLSGNPRCRETSSAPKWRSPTSPKRRVSIGSRSRPTC